MKLPPRSTTAKGVIGASSIQPNRLHASMVVWSPSWRPGTMSAASSSDERFWIAAKSVAADIQWRGYTSGPAWWAPCWSAQRSPKLGIRLGRPRPGGSSPRGHLLARCSRPTHRFPVFGAARVGGHTLLAEVTISAAIGSSDLPRTMPR